MFKCLIKYKVISSTIEHETFCLFFSSRLFLPKSHVQSWLGNKTHRTHPKKASALRVTKSPLKIYSPFSQSLKAHAWVSLRARWGKGAGAPGPWDKGTKPLMSPQLLTDCPQRVRGLLAFLVNHMWFMHWP